MRFARRNKNVVHGHPGQAHAGTKQMAIVHQDHWRAFQDAPQNRRVALGQWEANIDNDECNDQKEGICERVVLPSDGALRGAADNQEQHEIESCHFS